MSIFKIIDHLGFACVDIQVALQFVTKSYPVEKISPIIFDPYQDASLCYIHTTSGPNIELISGNAVKNIITKGLSLYHTCYEVPDLDAAIESVKNNGGIVIKEAYPAPLFNNRRVAFLETELGLIELLESDSVAAAQTVCIAGTFNTHQIHTLLPELADRINTKLIFQEAPYNQILQLLYDKNSIFYQNKQGYNVIFLRLEDWFRFIDLERYSFNECHKILQNNSHDLLEGLKELAKSCEALIVCFCPRTTQLPEFLIKEIVQCEGSITEHLRTQKNIICSTDLLQLESTITHDQQLDQIGHIPFNEYTNKLIGLESLRAIHLLKRRPYKVIVVDCDNTLWDGVCGEEECNNLRLSAANLQLQRKLKELSTQGILICLCSKNIELDVLNVFAQRSDMLLSLDNISHYKINWHAKSENIRALAQELNLGIEDFVFIDDNPMEIAEVSGSLPEVLCLKFPTEEAAGLDFVKNNWALDYLASSEFDTKRTEFYKTNIQREQLMQAAPSFADFVEKLEIKLEINAIQDNDLPRVSQLTQRTNQFNLTTKRRSINQIVESLAQPNFIGYSISVADRFGDYGQVGVVLLDQQSQEVSIDTFLLSCRILGKGIEYQILHAIAKLTLDNNRHTIAINFEHTAKNEPALRFVNSLPKVEKIEFSNGFVLKCSAHDLLNFKPDLSATTNVQHITKSEGANNTERTHDNQVILTALELYQEEVIAKIAIKNNKLIFDVRQVQETLIALWAKFFGSEISVDDNFFDLGGDSLLAIQVISKIKKTYGLELNLDAIFNYPVLSELANYILGLSEDSDNQQEFKPIEKSSQTQLSYTQEWLWLLDQYDGGNSWYYNMPYAVRMRGELHISALELAFKQLIMRHEILRMNIEYTNSGYRPKIAENISFVIRCIDAQSDSAEVLKSLIDAEYRRPFDLSADLLIRATLFKLSSTEQVLLIVNHHIVSDGWSYRIINSELSALYNAILHDRLANLEPLTIQFLDYAAWHRAYTDEIVPNQIVFWEQYLKNLPKQRFPIDKPRQQRQHFGKYLPLELNPTTSLQLTEIARQYRISLFAVLITSYAILIAKYCKSTDIIITAPVSGRKHHDAEQLIGCFVNIIVFRLKISLTDSYAVNLANNREGILSALQNQDIPFDVLLKKLNLENSAFDSSIFQVMFALQNTNNGMYELDGIESSMFKDGYDAARLEFILELEPRGDKIIGGIYYNTSLFADQTIAKYSAEYLALCEYITANIDSPMQDFWNGSKGLSVLHTQTNYIENGFVDIVSWFESIASEYPANIALETTEHSLTYQELNSQANILANYLRKEGVVSHDIVALKLPANIYSIITIIAIMKVGALYLPIDISAPDDYVRVILADSSCKLYIDAESFVCKALENNTENCEENPIVEDRKLAYVIYTSGTTGKPKGVKIPHANIVQLMQSTQQEYKFKASDVMVLFHSVAFDFSVWEIWSALCFGAKLIIPTRQQIKSAQEAYELVAQSKVTVLNQTPTAFKQFCIYQENIAKTKLPTLRLVIFGGEKLLPADLIWFHEHNPQVRLYNMYGITETTVHVTIKRIDQANMVTTSNIGKPLPGRSLYILDEHKHIVPLGEVGEIYVSGSGLAEGYLHLDSKTDEVFVPDLFSKSERMYKSGDLARIVNGELEYIGRKDKQVQLRGFRIELSGIASILNQHPGVRYSAVDVVNDCLVAFVIPDFSKVLPFISKPFNPEIFILPNGLPIVQQNKNETEFLYEEIFEQNQYLSQGIELAEGACVVDVGANIGMFAVQAALVAKNATIYALEPIPDVYNTLQANADLYPLNIKPVNIGLSNTDTNFSLNYYPKMSVMSSASADTGEDKSLIEAHLKSKLGAQYNNLDQNELDELLNSYLDHKIVECKFETLDTFASHTGLTKIDLLKIDVEKHELEVLQGISKKSWKLIQQCVIELHDHDGSLQKIIDILTIHNFQYKIRQYHTLSETNLYTVYASRAPNFSSNTKTKELQYIYRWHSLDAYLSDIKAYMRRSMPEYMLPQQYQIVDQFPLTMTGKIDFSAFKLQNNSIINNIDTVQDDSYIHLSNTILSVWSELLGHRNIKTSDNFFDVGGNSLMTIQAYIKLRDILPVGFRMIDFFSYPTAAKLAQKIASDNTSKTAVESKPTSISVLDNDIAVIGYAGMFPGAEDLEEYWDKIISGSNCITYFSTEELLKHGVAAEYLADAKYVKACGKVDDLNQFDYEFFGITARDAAMMDPQHRIFLQLCWRALESACYTADKTEQIIGLFAGMGHPHYLDALYQHHNLKHSYGRDLIVEITNHKDYLVNRVAYKLNLTGASININTACSTSLVACVKACQSLLLNENDIALAGGISLVIPENYGYFYQAENVLSPDGVCRPFDKNANGTVIGSGAGVVVLKKLSRALADGDHIKAVIKGYAVNNDGNEKIGFTAPGARGQANCIARAQAMANISPKDISYLEAHGTGTLLGDPIEINSLMKVFDQETLPAKNCAIGSVKANIGHADSASGIAGLLKVILMLERKQLPPMLNYHSPNEQIDFDATPFYVNTEAKSWQGAVRYAGISSFGIGGTNAHLVLSNAPAVSSGYCNQQEHLLIVSAKSENDLQVMCKELLSIVQCDSNNVADIAYTLQVGRTDFEYRRAYYVDQNSKIIDVVRLSGSGNNLVSIAHKWLRGDKIDWAELHVSCKHQRYARLPSHPFNSKSCWYTDLDFAAKTNSLGITETISSLVQNLLGISECPLESDIFSMGADSLMALSLIEQIHNLLAVHVSLDEVFEAKSLKNIAEVIRSKKYSSFAELKLLKHSNSKVNMLLIHTLGGSLYCYDYLVKNLNVFNIYGISNDTTTNSALDSIELLASEYVKIIESKNIKPPYVLLGWSFGGTLAFEIARQLKVKNLEVQHVYMLDAWCKFDAKFIKEESALKHLYIERTKGVNDTAWAKQWNQVIWQRSNMIFSYTALPSKIPSTLFKARNILPEYQTMDDKSNYWQPVLGDILQVVELSADHMTIVNEENSLQIAQYINQEQK